MTTNHTFDRIETTDELPSLEVHVLSRVTGGMGPWETGGRAIGQEYGGRAASLIPKVGSSPAVQGVGKLVGNEIGGAIGRGIDNLPSAPSRPEGYGGATGRGAGSAIDRSPGVF